MTPDPGRVVVKTMSITRADFARSLARLDGDAVLDAGGCAQVRAAGVHARIQFDALPPRKLGGLLAMPQARVTIALPDEASSAARVGFLARFDVAFQRGGG